MNKIVAAILEEFSKANGIEKMEKKLDPYFLAALAGYRLEVRLRTKELRAYKSARCHMILAMRLLLDPLPNSQMNSKDMEKRCGAMISVLSDRSRRLRE